MRSFYMFLILMVVALFASGPAFAQTETVLFYDDFESQPAGSVSHAAYPDTTVAADPSAASVGTWTTVDSGPGGEDVQVTDYGTPGAAGGNNYLRLMGRQLTSYVEAVFEEQSTWGDTVRVEMDMFNPAGEVYASPIIKGEAPSGRRQWTVISDRRHLITPYDFLAFDSYTSTYPPIPDMYTIDDEWAHLQFDWTLGEPTMTMTYGTQVATVPVDGNGAQVGIMGRLEIIGGYYDDHLTYFDNVKVTVISPLPHPGDANDDGEINQADAAILANNWLTAGGWEQGDFNDDGIVDDKDATILAVNWTGTAAQVPEPSTGLMILLGILCLLGIVRRK